VEATSPVATTRQLLDALADPMDQPIISVNLDAINTFADIPIDPIRPIVVVGISATGSGTVPKWVDVALTDAVSPRRPWVSIVGRKTDLETLAKLVQRHPQASVMAAQVMRMSAGLDATHALFVESLAYGILQAGPEHRQWLHQTAGRHAHHEASGEPDVLVARRGDELHLILNRPRRRNAYRAKTRDELVDGFTLAMIDQTITTVHLQGNGPSFSSGGDLTEFGTVRDGPSGHFIRSARNAARLLAELGDRSVASVHGPCFGAGVELSAACRTVRSTPDATFTLPEVEMGLIPGAGGTWSIPTRIGRHRATWLALTGATLRADDALAWGLVDEIVDPPTMKGR